jgi:hypothetical protein
MNKLYVSLIYYLLLGSTALADEQATFQRVAVTKSTVTLSGGRR